MGVAERESELDTELETEEVAEEQVQETETEETETEETSEAEDEDVITLGSEEPPASEEAKAAAPEWVKDLRRKYRDLAAAHAKLTASQPAGQPTNQGKPTLPPKPKMADPDIDYDEEKFEQARDAWESKKRDIDAWEDNQRNAQEAQQKAGKAVHEAYVAQTKALKVKDFQEAEETAAVALDDIQQAILKKGATNPAHLVYALGKNPKKLQELASIKDPVKFAVAVGKLETEVKVTKRTSTKPAPESTVRGSSGSATPSSDTLKRLQAEADKTGDRTKVAAYLRQQKQAGK